MKTTTISSMALALSVASAHTIMQAVGVGSTMNPQGFGIYMPSDDGYIADVTSASLACNGAPITGFTSSKSVIPVVAGQVVTGSWLHTLTSTGPDSEADNKVIASSHKGPVMAYLKKVSDATQNPSAGPGDGWFKIAEAGLISSTEWGVDALISAGGVQNVTIPTCIANGDYLLRFELIALHSASTAAGAQFYMECAQLSVTGGTGAATPATVAIPGVYSATDPGILVNIYNNNGQPYPSSYAIPGPAVFTCPAGGAAAPAPSSSAAAPAPSSSAAKPAMSSSAAASMAKPVMSSTAAAYSYPAAASSMAKPAMSSSVAAVAPVYTPTTMATSVKAVVTTPAAAPAMSGAAQTFVCQAY